MSDKKVILQHPNGQQYKVTEKEAETILANKEVGGRFKVLGAEVPEEVKELAAKNNKKAAEK